MLPLFHLELMHSSINVSVPFHILTALSLAAKHFYRTSSTTRGRRLRGTLTFKFGFHLIAVARVLDATKSPKLAA